MEDVVERALLQHRLAGNADISWKVCFVNNVTLTGTIKSFAGQNYALNNSLGPVYFSADKVAYLYPSD